MFSLHSISFVAVDAGYSSSDQLDATLNKILAEEVLFTVREAVRNRVEELLEHFAILHQTDRIQLPLSDIMLSAFWSIIDNPQHLHNTCTTHQERWAIPKPCALQKTEEAGLGYFQNPKNVKIDKIQKGLRASRAHVYLVAEMEERLENRQHREQYRLDDENLNKQQVPMKRSGWQDLGMGIVEIKYRRVMSAQWRRIISG